MTLKRALRGTMPVGTVCQGFSSALSQVPRKTSAYVTTLDASVCTQFLFFQGQVHINRPTGDSCEVNSFPWTSPASFLTLFPAQDFQLCFPIDTMCFPAFQSPPLPHQNKKALISTFNFEQCSIMLKFKSSYVFVFLNLLLKKWIENVFFISY